MLHKILWLGLVLLLTRQVSAEVIHDPYLWLEDITGEKALAWVSKQNAESLSALTASEAFTVLKDHLLSIYDSEARIPYITKAGAHYYNFWRDTNHKRGVWRRTTLDEYRKAEPTWEIVLDLDALAKGEGENWVWKGAHFLKPSYRRCLVRLSRGGADAVVIREFDLATQSFVTDGFSLPEAKSHVTWRGMDSLFVATDFGPGSLTASGYARVLKVWKRGTPLREATTVFAGRPKDVRVWGYRDMTRGYERDFVFHYVATRKIQRFLRRHDALIRIKTPDDAKVMFWRQHLLIELRRVWQIGHQTYPAGALLATDFEAFLRGQREFDVLFQPTERQALAGFTATRHHVMINVLDNIRNRIEVLTHRDGVWHREPLPGVPALSTVWAYAVDPDVSDDYLMRITDFLTPWGLFHGTLGQGPAVKLKQGPAVFSSEGLVVSQHVAVSKDGTRIPYFQIARRDLALNGKQPTLLYGYGGFEYKLVPRYQTTVGAAWLEKGGVSVMANIRGGGEFGPQWHQAALKANRPRAYEDFIAVAEDLIRRNVTSPQSLGIMGGSNGGLLVGNMLTMRPELFNAVVSLVPLLDMYRYHKLLAGASWIGEYGNPDIPEEWAFIRTFSPYHNVNAQTSYPRTLFMTSTRDDRVHPAHARKMVAKMKAMGHDVLYYENTEGGHRGAANNPQTAFMRALVYTFLWSQLK